MHEFLQWFAEVSAPVQQQANDGSNNKDVLVSIIGTVGTVVVAGLSLFIASFHRAKTPDSTVDSIENQANIRRETAAAKALQDAKEDLDVSNWEKDHWHEMYNRLREAVRAKGLNPDTIMSEL